MIGFLFGFSMFIPAMNVLVVLSHTIGCIYTCAAIMQAWHFLNLWYIVSAPGEKHPHAPPNLKPRSRSLAHCECTRGKTPPCLTQS